MIISMNLLWICHLWDPFEFLWHAVWFLRFSFWIPVGYPIHCFGTSSATRSSRRNCFLQGNGYCLFRRVTVLSRIIGTYREKNLKRWSPVGRPTNHLHSPYTTRINPQSLVHPLDFFTNCFVTQTRSTSPKLEQRPILAPWCHVFSIILGFKFWGICSCSSPFTTFDNRPFSCALGDLLIETLIGRSYRRFSATSSTCIPSGRVTKCKCHALCPCLSCNCRLVKLVLRGW